MGQQGELTLPASRLRARQSRSSRAQGPAKGQHEGLPVGQPGTGTFHFFHRCPGRGYRRFSFLQWDLLTPPKFAGLANFRMLFHDGELPQALFNSLLFDIMTTTLHIVIGMGLAIAVTAVCGPGSSATGRVPHSLYRS